MKFVLVRSTTDECLICNTEARGSRVIVDIGAFKLAYCVTCIRKLNAARVSR